ncbi:MAG TPA: amidohydrolase [Clostridiaceae bacterium]|nr:amidohydrolase [Clostridiaceae bacterium]
MKPEDMVAKQTKILEASSIEIKKISEEIHEKLIKVRRRFHKHPELGMDTYKTAEYIMNYLKQLNIEVTHIANRSGVIGLIRGKKQIDPDNNEIEKTIALRADIDALSVFEENQCNYKSEIPGVMHACGHDFHTTCLLGAAETLNRLKDSFSGNIKLLFQPGEESLGGAATMLEEGALNNPDVSVCAALHAWPDIPVGKVAVKYGAAFSAIENFKITVTGKGGHGAVPHKTVDPIVIGCNIVNALQTIVSREVDSFEPAIVSICSFNAGTSVNIIPDISVIGGTIRTFDTNLKKFIEKTIFNISEGIAKAMGAGIQIEFTNDSPPVINDEKITKLFISSASRMIGEDNVIISDRPSMVSEDFALIAEKVPSVYFWLGCRNEEKGIINPLHSSKFQGDEDCIKVGTAVFAQFALDYLNQNYIK